MVSEPEKLPHFASYLENLEAKYRGLTVSYAK